MRDRRRGTVRVEIERLVVDGGSAADGRELARAIERELGERHRSAPGWGGGAGGRVELGDRAVTLPSGAAAGEIGARVAEVIWQAGRAALREEEG